MNPSAARLTLPDYYAVETLNSMAGMTFLYCIYFWTGHRFGYTDAENLLVNAASGLVYIFASMYGGRMADRLGYDRLLGACLAFMAASLLTGWLPGWRWTPFLVMAAFTLFQAPSWTALEGAVVHVPGRLKLADRVGIYNLAWAFGGPVGYFSSGYLFRWRPDAVLWAPGLLLAGALLFQRWRVHVSRSASVAGGAKESAAFAAAAGIPLETRRRFMHFAWMGNALGYTMIACFTALVPDAARRLGLEPAHAIWLASSFLFMRAAGFILFWRWHGWLYDRGLGLLAYWAAPLSLCVIFWTASVPVMLVALLIFGAALGLTYSGSLYYSLNAADTKGTQGGLHEAILGIGIFTGPLVGAAATRLPGGTDTARLVIAAFCVLASAVGLLWLRLANRPAAAAARNG